MSDETVSDEPVPGGVHLDDEALNAVLDEEAGADEAAHARSCSECSARLERFRVVALAVAAPVEPVAGERRRAAVARCRRRRRGAGPGSPGAVTTGAGVAGKDPGLRGRGRGRGPRRRRPRRPGDVIVLGQRRPPAGPGRGVGGGGRSGGPGPGRAPRGRPSGPVGWSGPGRQFGRGGVGCRGLDRRLGPVPSTAATWGTSTRATSPMARGLDPISGAASSMISLAERLDESDQPSPIGTDLNPAPVRRRRGARPEAASAGASNRRRPASQADTAPAPPMSPSGGARWPPGNESRSRPPRLHGPSTPRRGGRARPRLRRPGWPSRRTMEVPRPGRRGLRRLASAAA